MAAQPLSKELMREALEAVALFGSITNAAIALNIPRETFRNRLQRAQAMPPELLRARTADSTEWHSRITRPVENGTIVVFSDAKQRAERRRFVRHWAPSQPQGDAND